MNIGKDAAPQMDRITLPSMPLWLLRLGRSEIPGTKKISDTEAGWQVVIKCALAAAIIIYVVIGMITAVAWANEQTAALSMASTTLIGVAL